MDREEISEAEQDVFLHALDKNDADAVRCLMSSGVHPDSELGIGCSPLTAAATAGQLEIAELLIENGANVNLVEADGDTPLALALAAACDQREDDDVDAEENEAADAAAWQAVLSGPHVQIAKLLLKAGAKADTTNAFINRFFMTCCREGSVSLVRTLLEHGADVNAKDDINMTPLMYAMSQPEVFRLLLDRGADVNIQCDLGVTVLDVLLGDRRLDLAQLVIDHGGDVNERNYYLTRAAADGEMDVVRFLLRNGADPEQVNDEGETASSLARLHGHRDIALVLREARGLPEVEAVAARDVSSAPEAMRQRTARQRLIGRFIKKNFRRDGKEIFMRAWWLAHKVTHATLAQFAPTAISSWISDDRFREQDQKLLAEVLGYTMSYVLDTLRDEIEDSHGWTDETYELNIGYQVSLGIAFDQVFGLRDQDKHVFGDILSDYYGPEYDDGYDDLWEVCSEPVDEWSKKTVGELLSEQLSDDDYNVERYYVYRLSKIVNIVDPGKVIDSIVPYRGIGLAYYDRAFFGLGIRTIRSDLRNTVNR